MDPDHLMPEDFPGYDWSREDYLADQADIDNARWAELELERMEQRAAPAFDEWLNTLELTKELDNEP